MPCNAAKEHMFYAHRAPQGSQGNHATELPARLLDDTVAAGVLQDANVAA